MLDTTTDLGCPEHHYRVHRFTRERISEALRLGNADLYLELFAQAVREMGEPAMAGRTPVERWILDDEGREW